MIRRLQRDTGYVVDPHTACALVAAEKTRGSGAGPLVVLATAHPAKFPDAMEAFTGQRPALPARLSPLMTQEERVSHLPNDLATLEQFIEAQACRVAEQQT